MIKYIRLDAEQFIKDSRFWDDEIQRLQEEFETVPEINAVPQSPVKSSSVSSPVEAAAIDRDRLQRRIERLRDYQAAFKFAWDRLDDYDQDMIAGFFFNPGGIPEYIDSWCTKYHSNRQYCYRDRRAAVSSFRRGLETWARSYGWQL